jgi:multidrug efflux pump subunit AcrA (membrane-fusion protein)
MKIRKLVAPLVSVAVLAGAGYAGYRTRDRWLPHVFPPPPADAAEAGHDDHAPADRVKLSPQAVANLGLDVGPLQPGPYWRTALIPGSVVDRPGETDRTVPARVGGIVRAVRARPGDDVRAGDPLFVIQVVSEYAQGLQGDLARAAEEQRIAVARRDRTAGLVRQGSPESLLLEPEAQVQRVEAQVRVLRRQLSAVGLTPEQVDRAERGEPVSEVVITTPAPPPEPARETSRPAAEPRFEVQELKVHLGDQVQAGQPLCVLSDHRRVMVEGRAFPAEAAAVGRAAAERRPVAATFAGEAPGVWPPAGPLYISHVSGVVDHATHTLPFYLPLDNPPPAAGRPGWRHRPGQRVRLRVPVEKLGDDVFALPAAAVVREGAEAFVFVQNGDLFVRKPVRVLYEDRTDAVLANDGSVTAGQFVARNGAAALNRAIKAAAGGGDEHGHDHDH